MTPEAFEALVRPFRRELAAHCAYVDRGLERASVMRVMREQQASAAKAAS